MKISAILTVTNPTDRQDPWRECLSSLSTWADEIIIVDGGTEFFRPGDYPRKKLAILPRLSELNFGNELDFDKELTEAELIQYPWPNDWSWEELPKHLNRGLQEATGDWVVRVDADYIFKPDTREILEPVLEQLGDTPVATMQKFSAVLWNKFYQKGGVKMVINKKAAPNVVFGQDREQYTDLCVPIFWDQESRNEFGVPVGQVIPDSECGRTKVEFFNYDYTFKTKEVVAKEFFKFSMAHKRYFGTSKWGNTEEEALQAFVRMMKTRLDRCVYKFGPDKQPEAIQRKLTSITPEQFGYSGWGELV